MTTIEFKACISYLPAISEFISKQHKIPTSVGVNLDRSTAELFLQYNEEFRKYNLSFNEKTGEIKISLVETKPTHVQQTIPLEGYQPIDKLDTSNPPTNNKTRVYRFESKEEREHFKEGTPSTSPKAKNGKRTENGDVIYYKDGMIHREDGPAMECKNGDKFWFHNEVPHRIGGPACEFANGPKMWMVNGVRHREDGPAIENTRTGNKYFLNGKELTEQEYNRIMFEK